jgi:hypothetical protein
MALDYLGVSWLAALLTMLAIHANLLKNLPGF